MNIHSFARTPPLSRGVIAARRDDGERAATIAAQFGIDRKTIRKWHRRKQEGTQG